MGWKGFQDKRLMPSLYRSRLSIYNSGGRKILRMAPDLDICHKKTRFRVLNGDDASIYDPRLTFIHRDRKRKSKARNNRELMWQATSPVVGCRTYSHSDNLSRNRIFGINQGTFFRHKANKNFPFTLLFLAHCLRTSIRRPSSGCVRFPMNTSRRNNSCCDPRLFTIKNFLTQQEKSMSSE